MHVLCLFSFKTHCCLEFTRKLSFAFIFAFILLYVNYYCFLLVMTSSLLFILSDTNIWHSYKHYTQQNHLCIYILTYLNADNVQQRHTITKLYSYLVCCMNPLHSAYTILVSTLIKYLFCKSNFECYTLHVNTFIIFKFYLANLLRNIYLYFIFYSSSECSITVSFVCAYVFIVPIYLILHNV
jgi:hypothetical protein